MPVIEMRVYATAQGAHDGCSRFGYRNVDINTDHILSARTVGRDLADKNNVTEVTLASGETVYVVEYDYYMKQTKGTGSD